MSVETIPLTGEHANTNPKDKWTKLLQAPGPFSEACDADEWLEEASRYSELSEIPLGYIIQAKIKGAARHRWDAESTDSDKPELKFKKLFCRNPSLLRAIGEVIVMKRAPGEDFSVFYHRTDIAVRKLFSRFTLSEANLHKEILMENCSLPSITEKCALKPSISRASILEMGKALTKLEVTAINTIDKPAETKEDSERRCCGEEPECGLQQQVNLCPNLC